MIIIIDVIFIGNAKLQPKANRRARRLALGCNLALPMKMTSMMMITMTPRHQMISQRKAMMMHLAIAPMLCRLTPFEKDRQNKNPMIG